MRIGCVTRHAYPSDQEIRIAKFSATLGILGHQFHVFCPSNLAGEKNQLLTEGKIVRLVPPYWMRSFGKYVFAPLPINPIWLLWLYKQFSDEDIDLVIVRDLRLAIPAFLAAKWLGLKTILDIGEHYPGMMEVVGKQNLSHFVIRNDFLIRKIEAMSVRMADCVWVVAEENRQRLSRYSRNIRVICNYPMNVPDSALPRASRRVYSESGAPVKLVSLGLIDNIRGLDLAIHAFSILVRDLENINFTIYGDGFFRNHLAGMVRSLNLEGKVIFGGWVPEAKKHEIMADGDIGLILHKVCDLTQHTVPNKLFDYMSVGLPIISTKLRPVERVLEAECCGVSVDESPGEIAACMKRLIMDFEMRRRLSENGYRAVRSNYLWSGEVEKIDQTIRSLALSNA